jgi:hypothetical protein
VPLVAGQRQGEAYLVTLGLHVSPKGSEVERWPQPGDDHEFGEDLAKSGDGEHGFQVLLLISRQSCPPLSLIHVVATIVVEEDVAQYLAVAELDRVREAFPDISLQLKTRICKALLALRGRNKPMAIYPRRTSPQPTNHPHHPRHHAQPVTGSSHECTEGGTKVR